MKAWREQHRKAVVGARFGHSRAHQLESNRCGLRFLLISNHTEYNAPCHYDSSNSDLGCFLTSTSGVFPHTSQISGMSSSVSSSFFSPSTSASSCSPPLFFSPPAPSTAMLSGSSPSRPRIRSRARRFLGSPWTCCFHGGDEVHSLVMHAMPKSLGKIYASPPCE